MDIRFDNLFKIGGNSLSAAMMEEQAEHLPGFLESFYAREQGFHALPKVKAQVLAVKALAERLRGKFEAVAVLGIGGSALGITCVRDALKGVNWNVYGDPKLFVLDNLDLVPEFERMVDVDKTLFVVISKSGRTPETMALYYYFRNKVSSRQFVFITDPEEGELRKIGEVDDIPMLDIPANVGGRFSVLTPVGLFPMALLGVDIESMLEGAEEMAKSFQSKEMKMNLPFQLATVQYLLEWKQGVNITVMMPYSSSLKTLGDWYAQLLAESIGKDGKGLTPVSALGVTDQHSQIQLYNEGPTDKLLMFIEVEVQDETRLPMIENEALSYLSEISLGKLMATEFEATVQAVTKYEKPNITLRVPRVDARCLGALFMLFEGSIAFLGEYYRINAFDQPGVELGKQLTKKLLSHD